MLRIDRGLRMSGLIGTLLSMLILGGCLKTKVGFDSPAPSKRLEAIAHSSQESDDLSRAQLVEKLSSLDPAERMLAIRALESREGTTLGYDHAAPQWERLEAVERWRVYIVQEPQDPTLSGDTEPQTDSPMNPDTP